MPLPMAARARLTYRPLGRADTLARFHRALRGATPFLLESSLRDAELGRYSFLGSDPIGWFRSRGDRHAHATPGDEERGCGHPLDALRAFLARLPSASAGRPPLPFVGGLVGTFAYDLGRRIERIPDTKGVDLGVPDIHLAWYPRVTVIDHAWGEAYELRLRDAPEEAPPHVPDDLAVPPAGDAVRPLDRASYTETIEDAKTAIAEGEIFQVNLSQRHALPLSGTPAQGYERLRARTPATFAAYVDAGDHVLLSSSPERFLSVRGPDVETRPIKGTRPRGSTRAEDRVLAAELLASAKDAAENVMIVDLERNDLGKVSEFGSVHVPVFQALRTLPTVHHLESVVRARLRANVDLIDLLRATFPGGSITGAPKPRAMEIIERLEPPRRGGG